MLNALLWNLLLTAALALVLAVVCRFPSMHRRPALRYWLWLLLVVKLVTPPLVAVPLLPAIPDAGNAPAVVSEPSRPTWDSQLVFEQDTQAIPDVGVTSPTSSVVVDEGLEDDAFAATLPEPSGVSWLPYIAGLLATSLLGTCVLLTISAVRAVKLYRWISRAGAENSLLSKACGDIASSLGIRAAVRSCVVDARTTPLLWAWRRPLIVMPRRLVEELDPQQLRGIVAHELAHLLRRDHWANVFVFIVKILMWWNPVIWWAERELRVAQELCCDAIAIDRSGDNRNGYATTLLKAMDFIQEEPLVSQALAPGMGCKKSILRRFEMIGEKQLSYKLSRWTLLLLLAFAVPLMCIPVRAQEEKPAVEATATASEDDDANTMDGPDNKTPKTSHASKEGEQVGGGENDAKDLDHINASPLEEEGVYHVTPVFKKLVKVKVVKRGGPYGPDHTRVLKDWSFNKNGKTGRLVIKEKVDNEKEMVIVYGERKVPWAWQMTGPLSDVKVLIGEKAAIRGEDYEVDEAVGIVRFLKKEHCNKGVHYYISYTHSDEPSKGGAIGNHPDRALVRKFLGIHPTPDKKEDVGKTTGINASRTDNPRVWTMMQSMRSDSIRVGIGRYSVKGKLDWIERGKDFAYDETLGTITLLREIPLDEDSWIFVSGVPTERGRFLLHSELEKGEVKVILGDRLLKEGVGYKVDYEKGIVTIVDKAIEKKGAKYHISTGGRSMSNHPDRALVRKLLGTTETVYGKRPQGNCSISGKVVSAETGKPIENARMYLHDKVTHSSIFIHTSSDGAFEFKDIPKGPFSLQLSSCPGYQDVAYNPEGNPDYIPSVTLKDGEQRTGIVLKAKRAYKISGKIVDENGKAPISSKTMSAWACFARDDGKGYSGKIGYINPRDGSYQIDGLSGKPVYVMARDFRAAKKTDPYPPIYYPGTFSQDDAKKVVFGEKRHVENIDIKLRKEGGLVLEGTVTDQQTHKPIPKTLITVHHENMLFDRVTTYTDEKGAYRVRCLGPGQLVVHVDASPWGYVRTRKVVTLDNKKKNTSLDLSIKQGVPIRGKFVDENDKAVNVYNKAFGVAYLNGQPAPEAFSLGGMDNKHAPTDVFKRERATFISGKGDYEKEYMYFPTKSTFVIPAMKPGHIMFRFFPKQENQRVVKIMHNGKDILKSGIEAKPGQEIKDVKIVIGRRSEKETNGDGDTTKTGKVSGRRPRGNRSISGKGTSTATRSAETKVMLERIRKAWERKQKDIKTACFKWQEGAVKKRLARYPYEAIFKPANYQVVWNQKFCLDGKMTNYESEIVGALSYDRQYKKCRYTYNGKSAASLHARDKISGTILAKAENPSRDQLACAALQIALRPLHPQLGKINLADYEISRNRSIVDMYPCVVLKERQYQTGLKHTYHVCPGMDFAILRFIESFDGKDVIQLDIKYQKTDKYGWLPSSWKHDWTNPESKTLVTRGESTVTSYTINERIPPTEFQIEFPENALVWDEGSDETYRIGPKGRRELLSGRGGEKRSKRIQTVN